MLSRRLFSVLALIGALVAVSVWAVPAHAGDAFGSVDCRQDPDNPSCTVQVRQPGASPGPASETNSGCRTPSGASVPCSKADEGWLADDGCYYQPASGSSLKAANSTDGAAPAGQQWYLGSCDYPPYSGQTRFRLFAAVAKADPGVLAAQAAAQLDLPAPVVQLSPSSPERQLVHLPMWVWLDASSWASRSATASVPGLSVTATATADRLVLSAGDRTTVVCRGAGTAWTAGMNPGAVSPTCGHTYGTSGTFRLTATVSWTVVWSGDGATGTEPELTTVTSFMVSVREAVALNGERG